MKPIDENTLFLTFNQIADSSEYPFTRGMLERFWRDGDKNGLKSCGRKVGKTIVLQRAKFDQWLIGRAK